MKRYLIAIMVGLVPASAEAVQWLKQSTAVTVKVGPFVDSSDASAETALTISQADIRLSKNGGAFAQTNNATGATHDENGYYGVPLDTTDTNTLGTLRIAVAESGTLPVWQDFMVVPANVYDSLVSGSDYIQTDLTQVGGTAAASALASASDVVDEFESQSQADPTGFHVNVLEVAGTGQTANDNGADINAILADTGTDGVLLSNGTGTGQISLSSGNVAITNANISTIVSTAWNANLATYSGTGGSVAEALAGIWTDTNAVDTQTEMRTFLTGADSPVLAEDNLPSNFSSLEINGSGAVDSMLQGFLDNTIAETTANNIATNFEVFFDNGDAITTNVIDDIGSGGSSLTLADIADAVWDESATGHTDAGKAGAQLWTDIDAILDDTGEIGAAGAGLSAVPWNASWDAEVQSEAQDALTASIGANGVSLSAIPWNATWDAEVQSEADDALVANHLDHLFAADYDPVSKPGTATALLNELIESDGGVSRFTANALEESPAAGTTQPRINYEPSVKLKLATRNDGAYVCDKPVRVIAGTFDIEKAVGIDCSPFFGRNVQVETVGTCTVSGGSITATGLGPRDEYAMIQLDGTATAGDEVTVDCELTMDNGDKIIARFTIEVGE